MSGKILSIVFICILLIGCSSVTPIGSVKYPPAATDSVEILYQEPDKPYVVIALISYESAYRFTPIPKVIEKCQELAAEVGADAIIITSTQGHGANTGPQANGKAVKWKL